MPKKYRLRLESMDEDSKFIDVDYVDFGHFVSRELKRLAKQINEPAPIIPVKGQTEMDLP